VATSNVYRVETNQTITIALDTVAPTWWSRNTGSGVRRFAPDVQRLTCSVFDGARGAVAPAMNAANARALIVNLQVRAETADLSVPGGVRTQRLTSTVPLRNFR
jgi:hypothetical protein